jgi:hypothetical protein
MTGAAFTLVSASTIHLVQQSATVRGVLADTNFTNTTDVRGSIVYRT